MSWRATHLAEFTTPPTEKQRNRRTQKAKPINFDRARCSPEPSMDSRYALSRNEEENLLKRMKASALKSCEIPVTSEPISISISSQSSQYSTSPLLLRRVCRVRRGKDCVSRVGMQGRVQGDDSLHGNSVSFPPFFPFPAAPLTRSDSPQNDSRAYRRGEGQISQGASRADFSSVGLISLRHPCPRLSLL